MAAVRRRDQCDKPVTGEPDFGTGVEVKIPRRELDPRFVAVGDAAVSGCIEQVIGGDQMLEDGVAEVREVSAAECTVPVAAIALAAVELGAGLVDERLSAGTAAAFSIAVRSEFGLATVRYKLVQPLADHLHAGVHFVGFGILHLEVSPI